jgi:hypothetical protein
MDNHYQIAENYLKKCATIGWSIGTGMPFQIISLTDKECIKLAEQYPFSYIDIRSAFRRKNNG